MTPDVEPELCRRCWSREDLGLGPCVSHREDPPSRELQLLERARDALEAGRRKKHHDPTAGSAVPTHPQKEHEE